MAESEEHLVQIVDRHNLFLQGAKEVESFDDKCIIAHTNKGTLSIKGENLHISSLNLEEEKLEVNGLINAVTYDDSKNKAKGGQNLLKKIFK